MAATDKTGDVRLLLEVTETLFYTKNFEAGAKKCK